ncbi:MAG: prolyl oligopeptidase family serine peptidase [Proteobacteria bacterium]|nr:prolyl oligopeptidase family serine peptidase [Pseudomonadota bacterium]
MLLYRTIISLGLVALIALASCANNEPRALTDRAGQTLSVPALAASSPAAEAMAMAMAGDSLRGELATSPRREYLFESRFGVFTHDPYRWMENPDDPELTDWIDAQNAATLAYIGGPLYQQVADEIREILQPSRELSAARTMIRSQLQERWQTTLRKYRPQLPDERQDSILANSPSGSYYVQLVSDSNSDLQRLEIVDTSSGLRLPDVLSVKFASVYWDEDERSFIYVTNRDGRIGHVRPAVFRHVLGTSQPQDTLLYQEEEAGVSVGLVRLGTRWLIFRGKGNGIGIGELDFETGTVTSILEYAPGGITPFYDEGDILYVINYRNAALGEISTLDLRNGALTPVMPEQEHAIDRATKAGSSLYVTLIRDAASRLVRYDMESGELRDIALPFDGTAYVFDGGDAVYVYLGSYSRSFSLWSYDPSLDQLSMVFDGAPLPFELESFRTYYRAHNGQRVPIWIVKRPDVELTPDTPVLLYGYGGFTINIMPGLSRTSMPWYQRGGVRAYVTLPGGLEYGEPWHQAGMRHNKSNVFEDFAAAARHLIDKGYTSRERLAASGGSNGGLLVGAVINRYPDLFRAAVPAVGVMDMTRFSLFTAGKWWVSEYGDRNDRDDYINLAAISPYHNIRHVAYPSVLVTTADFDDRVVPAHSFKYAARLQARQRGQNPVLLHTKRWGSHSSASGTLDEQVKGLALPLAFLMKELDMR